MGNKKSTFVIISIAAIILYALIALALYASFSTAMIWTSPMNVCGNHIPNSYYGYGEVKLGAFYASCDNVADDVCPEDYEDASNASITANCGSCIDPDCRGNLQGHVYDYNGMPLAKAVVTASPDRFNKSAPSMDVTALTDNYGAYMMNVPTGKYYFSASKANYDTEVKEAKVLRNQLTILNFNLLNGTCHPDCTNSYGRYNKDCEGVSFQNDSVKCHFFDNHTREICDTRLKGSIIYYGPLNDTAAFFTNCEGPPFPRYYSQIRVDPGTIKNLLIVEKPARLYNYKPVRIVLAYWSGN